MLTSKLLILFFKTKINNKLLWLDINKYTNIILINNKILIKVFRVYLENLVNLVYIYICLMHMYLNIYKKENIER